MAQFDVVDMNGKKVSTVELPTPCSGSPRTRGCPRGSRQLPGQPAPGHPEHQIRKESAAAARSLAPEGHRPRSSGFHPCTAVDSRRRRSGPQPAATTTPSTRRSSVWLCSAPCLTRLPTQHDPGRQRSPPDEYKTKTVVAFLAAVGAGKKNLIVNDTLDAKFVKSAANIPRCPDRRYRHQHLRCCQRRQAHPER